MKTPSDTQRILLCGAAQRGDGSILPLPSPITPGGGTSKAMAALLREGFVVERETADPAGAVRTDGNLAYGLFITQAGAAAVGIELPGSTNGHELLDATTTTTLAPRAAITKAATVLALVERREGATLSELIEATGWLPHTTRAALTGLRKKGHAIDRGKRDGVTCYTAQVQA